MGIAYARRARRAPSVAAFSLYWFGVGFFGVSDALFSLAVPLADPPLAFGLTILLLKTLLGCVGFAGLVYTLLYVYSGRRLVRPLVAAYLVVYALVVYGYLSAQPVDQEVQAWRSGLVYARPDAPAGTIGVLALFAPPLVAAIAYAGLYRRAADRAQRARIVAISASFAAFFGGLLLGWTGLSWPWWPVAEKVLAIATAAAVLAFLHPPAWLRARLGAAEA